MRRVLDNVVVTSGGGAYESYEEGGPQNESRTFIQIVRWIFDDEKISFG